jgi:hypothetical protein
MSKPRSDAKLLNLPEEQQARLADWLLSGMSYHDAREMVIKEFGVTVSLDAYRGFWQAVCGPALIAKRRRAVNTANEVAQEAEKNPGRFDQATIDALKQKAFELSISPGANPKDVKSLFSLVLKAKDQEHDEAQLKLDREKVEILTCEKYLLWFKDKRATEIAESNISTPDKVAKLRQLYFADVEELEKSGEVKLPQ